MSAYDHFGNSYTANAAWIRGGSDFLRDNGVFLQSLGNIVNPAETVHYMEQCGFSSHEVAPVEAMYCTEPAIGTIRGWHGVDFRFSTAFVDGHAAPTYLRGRRSPHLGHYPEMDHHHWRCVIMRGVGWQRDNLPAAPVQSNISATLREDCGPNCDDRPHLAPPAAPLG